MFPGVLALLERSLRIDARSWAPHLARFALMMSILIAISYATATNSLFGAPGLRFFRSIAYLNLVFMTLMGIGFFSTAITEEKEEELLNSSGQIKRRVILRPDATGGVFEASAFA